MKISEKCGYSMAGFCIALWLPVTFLAPLVRTHGAYFRHQQPFVGGGKREYPYQNDMDRFSTQSYLDPFPDDPAMFEDAQAAVVRRSQLSDLQGPVVQNFEEDDYPVATDSRNDPESHRYKRMRTLRFKNRINRNVALDDAMDAQDPGGTKGSKKTKAPRNVMYKMRMFG